MFFYVSDLEDAYTTPDPDTPYYLFLVHVFWVEIWGQHLFQSHAVLGLAFTPKPSLPSLHSRTPRTTRRRPRGPDREARQGEILAELMAVRKTSLGPRSS